MNTSSATETAVTLFKRGARKAPVAGAKGVDEEKGPVQEEDVATQREGSSKETEKALEATPRTSDVFSWQNLRYTVPIGKGETRLLLDNVSGYVVPGKLTALM